mgnify:CR=1 FL=1
MKIFQFLTLFLVILLSSCDKDNPVTETEPNVIQMENVMRISIDGNPAELFSFDCLNSPSVYAIGSRRDVQTGKYIFEQGFLKIPLANNNSLAFQTIIYSEDDISRIEGLDLKSLIETNPQILHADISFQENNLEFRNQFYNLSGLEIDYENRNVVVENEQVNIVLGNVDRFQCNNEITMLEMNVEYSGVIKTIDGSSQKAIDIDFKTYLYPF